MADEKHTREKEEQEQEQEYIEEEDEDFNPETNNDDDFSSDEDDDQERPKKKLKKDADYDVDDTLKEVKNANYSKIESEEGGLIKTRTQRALEEQQGKKFKLVDDYSSTVDIDELWKSLKATAKERLKHRTSSAALSPSEDSTPQPLNPHEKIKIKRKYEYAGEIVTEEKWVLRESAEAKAYLSTLDKGTKVESSNDKPEEDMRSKQGVNDKGEKLRTIRKRPPLLEGIINGSIKPKFNTLEKSRLDFAEFADKEGINDELDQHNKDGYLEKQDFLSRVQFHRDTQIKDIRRKELQNKSK